MKLFFNLFFILFFFSQSLPSKNFLAEYQIKTKGIKIGSLVWELEVAENYYKTFMQLRNKGFLSSLYKFKGEYNSEGEVINNVFIPIEYNQSWTTKKKSRDVKIVFNNQKVYELHLDPPEKELPRIKYGDLEKYNDPLTSFINILLNDTPSHTIDGRRIYLMFPEKKKEHNKILIKEYANIWADHKRNDLEYLEIYQSQNSLLPKKINIKFKGYVFSLIKN